MPRKTRPAALTPPRRALLALLMLALLLAGACSTKVITLPPPASTPSKVITTEGVEYYVWGLRFAGTRQELLLKEGGAQTWVPLSIVQYARFSGPEKDLYRHGEITFSSGEKVRGQVFVGYLLQGTTDTGYWNLPLAKVRQLGMGAEYPPPPPSQP